MILAFLRGLEKAPTFLVPIINPPFADNSPHFSHPGVVHNISGDVNSAESRYSDEPMGGPLPYRKEKRDSPLRGRSRSRDQSV